METTGFKIRNQIYRDLEEISKLTSGTPRPLSVETLTRWLRQKNCWCRVLESDEAIFGVLIYELFPKEYHITWMGVREDSRGVGIGRELIKDMKSKLTPEVRLIVEVPETNMEMLKFLKSQYFLAVDLIREDEEDLIVMEYLYDESDFR